MFGTIHFVGRDVHASVPCPTPSLDLSTNKKTFWIFVVDNAANQVNPKSKPLAAVAVTLA